MTETEILELKRLFGQFFGPDREAPPFVLTDSAMKLLADGVLDLLARTHPEDHPRVIRHLAENGRGVRARALRNGGAVRFTATDVLQPVLDERAASAMLGLDTFKPGDF